MNAVELAQQSAQTLGLIFGLSLIFGAVVQHSHFCTMGAISDVFNFGDWARMKTWALAAALCMLGYSALVYGGLINPTKALYASDRLIALSAAFGGLLFGFGMVLASGCGSKTLVRMGAGSLKSLVVFVVMGLTAYMTLKGITAVLRVGFFDSVFVSLASPGDLSVYVAGLTNWSAPNARVLASVLVAGVLLVWALHRPQSLGWVNALGALLIALVIVAVWWVSGSYAHLDEHPETLQEAFLTTYSGRMESLSFVSPMAHTLDWLMFYSDKSKVLTLGVVAVVGVTLGSTALALFTKTFRWEGFHGTQDTVFHLVGAILMGVGGVFAMGCTVGQGLSGISTLSLTSFVAVFAIIMGGVLGLRFQTWYLERSA
jgi:uncharacterized protein